jgi:hypothetical protein
MDNNTTAIVSTNSEISSDSSRVILIVSLTIGLALIAVLIFIVSFIHLKNNKGKKKTKEIQRLRSIFNKTYLKRDSDLSKFSLKISSNLNSECNKKADSELEKSNFIEFRTLNAVTESNQVNLSCQQAIQIKRTNNYILDSEKKTCSADVTTSTISPFQSKFAPKEIKENLFLTKLQTCSDLSNTNQNRKKISFKEDLKTVNVKKRVIK